MERRNEFKQLKWRTYMAWSYIAICLFDFMIGPIYYNILQFYTHGEQITMWQAVTLQGGGLYHLSMGAIVGISAYGRTQERISPNTPPYSPYSSTEMPEPKKDMP